MLSNSTVIIYWQRFKLATECNMGHFTLYTYLSVLSAEANDTSVVLKHISIYILPSYIFNSVTNHTLYTK